MSSTETLASSTTRGPQWRVGQTNDAEWREAAERGRKRFAFGDYGLADLVLYADPGIERLRRHKEGDLTRRRHNFDLHTSMRPYFQQWYESVANLDPDRVIWHHPTDGISADLLRVGRRPQRSSVKLLDRVLDRLEH